ncbi:MAG: hypothetical protein O9297_12325 [Flavobacterium sp.]|jgi:hypothetical protein|uniref:hypothetical protein n=1 Tax=Flavobacterium sp. TaxID=239 RepID=UPI0022C10B9D|nr:hypothetical protein [Flavobacterium sp.]MCZ8297991.1 hypothetical protein [Flavobacterium sp.]
MTIFPKSKFRYKSDLDIATIFEVLKENTSDGSLSSTAHSTTKYFVGTIENEWFKIISSASRTSMFCVFEGKITPKSNEIEVVHTFHPTFKILFIFWFTALISLLIFFPGNSNRIVAVALFTCFAFVLRYFLITIIFKKAEAEGQIKLIEILKLTEII